MTATENDQLRLALSESRSQNEKLKLQLKSNQEEMLSNQTDREESAVELRDALAKTNTQNIENELRDSELRKVNKELLFQVLEREKRALELTIANDELRYQNSEKEQRAVELGIANAELAFQNSEKEKRANELGIANIELAYQNTEKEKRAVDLVLANTELAFQNDEKSKRAYELIELNREVQHQYQENEKRVVELAVADLELDLKNRANLELDKVNKELAAAVQTAKIASKYSRSLIEASLDPLVTISPSGKITDVNQASILATGVSRDQLIGHDFSNFFTEPKRAQEGYELVFKNGSVSDYPLTIKHINGKLTDVLYNAALYKDDQENVLGVFAAARDVTAQKLISNYSNSLIEASRDPLFAISIAGKVTDLNYATVRVTERSREQIIGSDFVDFFTDEEKAREGYLEVFSKGFVRDYPLTIKDGKLTDVLFNGSVYKDDRGDILGAVVVARDITEQRIFEKQLMEARTFAESATRIAEDAQIKAESATHLAMEAVKAKQQFLSNMSHEIRTPMNAIIGFTTVVLKTDLTAKQKEYLTAIKISGDALIVLVNDILDLAKVDAGKMSFEKIPFKLSLSVSAMLHLFETKSLEKNLLLRLEYSEDIPQVMVGDPVRLHQIILNLLSNAVKFTSVGSITLGVRSLKEDAQKITIEFSVSDTGIGVAPDRIDKIFGVFQQATSGTSRIYGGTGLGLAIVKQLVEAQGGTVQVVSTVGVGSTFSFILDFVKTDEQFETIPEVILSDSDVKYIKVLVVEDIPLNQLLMKTVLDDFGFERDVVANGKLALERLETKAYDIVLMDLQMPIMNGFDATDYIRNTLHSNIPIIALTADVTTADLVKCKAVGMNDYVSKPVDEKLLYSKIMNLVKKPSNLSHSSEVVPDPEITERYTNLSYLNTRTKSNPALMLEMIRLYLDQTPALVQSMKDSMLSKDWSLMYSTVHKMIPSFSIVGIATEYESMAKKIQECASSHMQVESILELVLQIEKVCNQACRELEQDYLALQNTLS